MEEKISTEMAEQEFNRFCEAMDLETSVSDSEDRKAFESQKNKIVKAIKKGSLLIDEDGMAVYTTQRDQEPKTIKFNEMSGAVLMAMDGKKDTQNVAKMYSAIGQLTETSPKTFSMMKGEDIKVCMAIGVLILSGE